MNAQDPKLKHLYPAWFAVVMGLAGLSLAWHRAEGVMGAAAGRVAWVLAGLAASVFVVLALASAVRAWRHAKAWADDLHHPVRHAFVAAMPIGWLLLMTLAAALLGHQESWRAWIALGWWIGSLAQLGTTVWVAARWWRGAAAGGLAWPMVTPALFIPIVGNVLVPLAGVPLGHVGWSAAQFGVGLLFWPLVLALLLVRVATQGPWPERLVPANFIVIAPPAVVGLGLPLLGAPVLVAWALWGMALFGLLWCATLLPRILALPFGLPHWGMSFPLAALAALTLRLSQGSPGGALMQVLGVVLLALATLVIAALCMATLKAVRQGDLPGPEPVASLTPVAG
jgi:tellurite resistance protein